MANYRITIKINDYFPKIDAIPFDNYICEITCNNLSSKIKLTEYKYQYFQNIFKLQKNTDLLFNIKLINYLENNTLIGIYDLLLPSTKVNQTLQRKKSYYQQQVKLIMNSNVKIKLFGTMMNITSIYLDLIFELSYISNDPSSFPNKTNKLRIYDIVGNNPINILDDIFEKNYKKKIMNNNINNNIIQRLNQQSANKKSNNNYFLNDTYPGDLSEQKQNQKPKNYTSIKNHNHFNYNNFFNEIHSDINYNVMNNNYLNYFKIDNNSFPLNYKCNSNTNSNKTQPQPHYSKDFTKTNIIEKLNNITPETNNRNYIKNNSYLEKKYDNLNRDKNLITNKSHRNEKKNLTIHKNKNYTEIDNDSDILDNYVIKNDNKKINLEQKYFKYQIILDNKSNKNKGNYFNYIKKKQPIIYDKKNYIEKMIKNRLIKNQNKLTKNEKDNLKNIRTKKEIDRNNKNLTEINQNRTHNSVLKTPQTIRAQSFIAYNNNNNKQSSTEISNINNIKECISELNQIKNSKNNFSLIKTIKIKIMIIMIKKKSSLKIQLKIQIIILIIIRLKIL